MKKVKSFIKQSNIKSFIFGIAIAILISFGVTTVLAINIGSGNGGGETEGRNDPTVTYGFIGQDVGLVNKIGSLTIGKNTDDDWIMESSNKCLTQGDGTELQTCLSVVGSASFSKLTVLDMPAFIQNHSLFLNESGDQTFLANLPKGLVIGDFTETDDSIMVSSLQYEADDGSLAPRNLDEQRNLCSNSSGKLYVCAEPVYHWEVNTNEWTSCELNQQGSCSGTYTTTETSGGTCTGTYESQSNGTCSGSDGWVRIKKIDWWGNSFNWTKNQEYRTTECNNSGNKCYCKKVNDRLLPDNWGIALLVAGLTGNPTDHVLLAGFIIGNKELVWKKSLFLKKNCGSTTTWGTYYKPPFSGEEGNCSDFNNNKTKCDNPSGNISGLTFSDDDCSWTATQLNCPSNVTTSSQCKASPHQNCSWTENEPVVTTHQCSDLTSDGAWGCMIGSLDSDSNAQCTWNFPTGIQHNTYVCKDDSGNTVDNTYCSDLTKPVAETRSCKADAVCGSGNTTCDTGVYYDPYSGGYHCSGLAEDGCSVIGSMEASCAGQRTSCDI